MGTSTPPCWRRSSPGRRRSPRARARRFAPAGPERNSPELSTDANTPSDAVRAATLAAAVDAAPVCIFVADGDMRYRAVNTYACELLGYDEAELLTMRVPDIAIYDEAPREYKSMMDAAYLRGSSRLRAKDGEELVLNYVAGEVEVEDETLYVSVGYAEFVSD